MDIFDYDVDNFFMQVNSLLNKLLDTDIEYFTDVAIDKDCDIVINKHKIYKML